MTRCSNVRTDLLPFLSSAPSGTTPTFPLLELASNLSHWKRGTFVSLIAWTIYDHCQAGMSPTVVYAPEGSQFLFRTLLVEISLCLLCKVVCREITRAYHRLSSEWGVLDVRGRELGAVALSPDSELG